MFLCVCGVYPCVFTSWIGLSSRFYFFQQKTAYDMRISDWSSDVCSSDLLDEHGRGQDAQQDGDGREQEGNHGRHRLALFVVVAFPFERAGNLLPYRADEIGRAHV